MKIRRFYFVLLGILLIGCNYNSLEAVLSGGCYWDIFDEGSPHPINSCYKFEKDGSCTFHYYFFVNKIRTDSVFKYDNGDVVVPDKWMVTKDTIQIRSGKYGVLRYTPDSVFLKARSGNTLVLVKNCSTFELDQNR